MFIKCTISCTAYDRIRPRVARTVFPTPPYTNHNIIRVITTMIIIIIHAFVRNSPSASCTPRRCKQCKTDGGRGHRAHLCSRFTHYIQVGVGRYTFYVYFTQPHVFIHATHTHARAQCRYNCFSVILSTQTLARLYAAVACVR